MRALRYIAILLLFFNNISIAEEPTVEVTNKEQVVPNSITQNKASEEALANYETIKLSPTMKPELILNDKYTIETESILPHLKNIIIFDNADQFKDLPFIYKHVEDKIMGGAGTQCFVKGLGTPRNSIYNFIRKKSTYINPDTGEVLGTEFMVIGSARVAERGKDLVKMDILQSSGSIEVGDKLTFRTELSLPSIIKGKNPAVAMQGYIIDVEDGLWETGKYNNVIISLGAREGVEQGDVFNILRMGNKKDLLNARDYKQSRKDKNHKEELSASKYGELIVYKVFDKISLGIIMQAKFPITIFDVVKSEASSS